MHHLTTKGCTISRQIGEEGPNYPKRGNRPARLFPIARDPTICTELPRLRYNSSRHSAIRGAACFLQGGRVSARSSRPAQGDGETSL